MFAAACGASVGAGSGNSSTIAASPADTRAQRTAAARRRVARRLARRRPTRLGRAQPGARTEQQPPGHSAAERGLGQRDIGCRKTHPDQREQQAVGDKADNRGEGVARGNGPDGHAEDQEGEADIESQGSLVTA